MKKATEFLTAQPARLFLFIALILMCVMYFINNRFGISWENIFVELDGMVFDLFVFGVLLLWYEWENARKDRIKRYFEEIDDFRGCTDELAAYRTAGLIRRLNKQEGIKVLDLKRSVVSGTNLSGIKLLPGSDLSGGTFIKTDLTDAILESVDLHKANLLEAMLFNTNLTNANLEDAQVEKNWFDLLDYYQVIGRNQIKQTYYVRDKNEHGQFLLKKITP